MILFDKKLNRKKTVLNLKCMLISSVNTFQKLFFISVKQAATVWKANDKI